MPTYQYACTACGERLDAVQSFADEPLTECPQCEGRLRKLFSSVGIVFKGSGFYRTDSREAAKAGNQGRKGTGSTPNGAGVPSQSDGGATTQNDAGATAQGDGGAAARGDAGTASSGAKAADSTAKTANGSPTSSNRPRASTAAA